MTNRNRTRLLYPIQNQLAFGYRPCQGTIQDYKVADSAVEIYTYDKTTYAIWSCEDAGTVMSHSVAVTENETVTDVNALVKALVDDVETNHPRG